MEPTMVSVAQQIDLLSILIGVIGALILILLGLVGWIGNGIFNKLTSIDETIIALERDLSEKLGTLDTRVAVIETRMDIYKPVKPIAKTSRRARDDKGRYSVS